MDIYFSFFIQSIIYLAIIQSLFSLFYVRYRIVQFILMNSIAVIFVMLPMITWSEGMPLSGDIPHLTVAGLAIFPLTLILIILEYYDKSHIINTRKIVIILVPLAVILVILSSYHVPVLYLVHIASYLYILKIISTKIYLFSSRIFLLIILGDIMYLVAGILSMDPSGLSLSVAATAFFSYFTLFIDFNRRIRRYIRQLDDIGRINIRLNHLITRLRQGSEQFKRIISEKDIEILQSSRHASLAEITTGIAHELAQPLTGIRVIAQNMIDDINYEEFSGTEAVSELEKICSLVDKSTSIIDHIRNFSKKSGFSMRVIDINRAILNAVDLINQQMKDKNIEMILTLNENIPGILGDNLSLEQLIVNILINAKDAIFEKQKKNQEGSGLIKIITEYSSGSVNMIIADNGTGIPKEIIPKIWSPFFTSKKRTHGTGIGLSISKKILKAHNADVNLRSDETGTTFTFRFPPYEESLK